MSLREEFEKEKCKKCEFNIFAGGVGLHYNFCSLHKTEKCYYEFLEQQLQEKDKELKQERQAKEELLEKYKKRIYQNFCQWVKYDEDRKELLDLLNLAFEEIDNELQLIAKHTEKDKER